MTAEESLRRRIAQSRAERTPVILRESKPMGAIARIPTGSVSLRFSAPPPTAVIIGSNFVVRVAIANHLGTDLYSSQPHPVNLVPLWLGRGEPLAGQEGPRSRLAGGAPTGSETEFRVRISAPSELGQFDLVLSLVQEGVTWFHQADQALPLRTSVQVNFGEPT